MAVARQVVLLVVAVLVPSLGLAGCIGKDPAPAAALNNAAANNATSSNATLPDGRGVSSGSLETNKTETGMGGMKHEHDYWKGAEALTVFSNDIELNAFPVYPEGQGSQPGSVAYVKLPRPHNGEPGKLVFEGTTSVTVLLKDPRAVAFGAAAAPDPVPPGIKMKYRTAADDKFRAGPDVTLGTELKLPVTPKETDMPHSTSSLWSFVFESDKPSQSTFNLTIVIHRGSEIVNWPGHPDFYAERTERIVLDKDYKVHRSGADEGLLYGAGSTWNDADKLISYGTGTLDVFLNITSASSSNGASPQGYILEYHNATILNAEDRYSERLYDAQNKNDLKSYHFVVKIDPQGMDGPYQPNSRWAFRPTALFTYSNVPGVVKGGLCPGCFPYDIAYHMTIIAHKSADGMAGMSGM